MFNGVFSRASLPRIKDMSYVIKFIDKQSKGRYWVSLFINKHMAVYFDLFVMDYIAH